MWLLEATGPWACRHIGVFTKSSSFRVTEDPKIDTLATEFRAVTTIEDNIRLGQEVQEALIEEQYQLMLFYAGVVYAAIPGIGGDAWGPGQGRLLD